MSASDYLMWVLAGETTVQSINARCEAELQALTKRVRARANRLSFNWRTLARVS